MSLFAKRDGEPGHAGEVKGRSKNKAGYGIAETMLLMRTLPVDENVELVVRVVRTTLESMNVEVRTIIDDAEARQVALESRRAVLEQEIGELTRQIEMRREEIRAIEADLAETTTVRQRLELAQRLPERAAATPPPVPARANGKPEVRAAV